MKRILDHDPLTGMTTWHDYDSLTDTTTISEEQSSAVVDSILDVNKYQFNDETLSARGRKEAWWRVARIPVGVQYHWQKTYGVDIFNKNHYPRVRRLLNDPEWRYLRSARGQL